MEEKQLLEMIERDLTPAAYKSLVSYAQYILDYSYLWRRVDKVSPGGKTAEDFVQETLLKLLDGDRELYENSEYDFISSLRGHIKSVISSTFRRKEHQVTTNTLEPVDNNNDDDQETEIEDGSLSNLTLIELQESIESVYRYVGNDDELKDLIMCYEGGIYKRKEIADFLEISPDDVTNRVKRLHRKMEPLKKNND